MAWGSQRLGTEARLWVEKKLPFHTLRDLRWTLEKWDRRTGASAKVQSRTGQANTRLWQWIRKPVHHPCRRESKGAGGSLDSRVGEEKAGKGRAVRLEKVCASSALP